MPHDNRAQFCKQNYISLESLKRDGTPVQTPVWFVDDADVFYIYSLTKAGKVKRIQRNAQVRIAPCTMSGGITGQWVEAEAHIVSGAAADHGHALLLRKYGWQKRIGNIVSRLLQRERTVMTIRLLD